MGAFVGTEVRCVSAGPRATGALAEILQRVKKDDPFAPATVIVPSPLVGLHLRRRLAESGENAGLLNVKFLSLHRLAEFVAAPLLADRQPVTPLVEREALRLAMARTSGRFQRLAGQSGTASALLRTLRDLKDVPDLDPKQLAETDPDLAELFQAYEDTKRGFYDRTDRLLAAARADLPNEIEQAGLGELVFFLPRPWTAAESQLVEALVGAAPCAFLFEQDEVSRARDFADLCEVDAFVGPAPPRPEPHFARLVDAEHEARYFAGQVHREAERGVRFDRIAIVAPRPEPELSHAERHLAAAGVPCFRAARRKLAQTRTGRLLQLLADLSEPDQESPGQLALDIQLVFELSDLRELDQASRWRKLARKLNLVRGEKKLTRALERYRLPLEPESKEARLTKALEDLLNQLAGDLRLVEFKSWSRLAATTRKLLATHASSGSAEPDDLERCQEAIEGWKVLDNLGEKPTRARWLEAVATTLAQPASSQERYGQGVFLGTIEQAHGLDFDAVFVLGLADHAWPARYRDDPVLPDTQRKRLHSRLPNRENATASNAALQGALTRSASNLTLSHAKVDRRAERPVSPSSWWLEELSSAYGERVYATDLERVTHPRLFMPASYVAALGNPSPAHAQELALQKLSLGAPLGEILGESEAERQSARALGARSAEATEFDGMVQLDDPPNRFSASSLEDLATCPYRYFLKRVLSVEPTEPIDEDRLVDALDLGNLYHDVLHSYYKYRQANPESALAERQAWLQEAAEAQFVKLEINGKVPEDLRWDLRKETIKRDLRLFAEHDVEFCQKHASRQVEAEKSFSQMLPVAERLVQFSGKIDRVDEADDTLILVDFKSGSDAAFNGLSKDPLNAGRSLQLPLYAEVSRLSDPQKPVRLFYWLVTARGKYRKIEVAYPDDVAEAFWQNLAVCIATAEQGAFPARPFAELDSESLANCRYCDYQRICPVDRGRRWRAKRDDPRLQPLRVMETATRRPPKGGKGNS
jgi:RecB family exonuclease